MRVVGLLCRIIFIATLNGAPIATPTTLVITLMGIIELELLLNSLLKPVNSTESFDLWSGGSNGHREESEGRR